MTDINTTDDEDERKYRVTDDGKLAMREEADDDTEDLTFDE